MIDDFFLAWEELGASCPDATWAERDGLVSATTGLPVPAFNGVWQHAEEVTADAVLTAVDEMAQRGLPWNVQLRPGYPPVLDRALAEYGLTHAEDIPFMVLRRPPSETVEVAFRQVVSFEDVGEHLRLLELGFGMPTALSRGMLPISMLFLDGVSTWLGEVDGEVVTTALGHDVGSSVGVFNVATPEKHRRKGYGAAATAHAVRAAGGKPAWLQSSAVGQSVYQGLGFEVLEQWRQWLPS